MLVWDAVAVGNILTDVAFIAVIVAAGVVATGVIVAAEVVVTAEVVVAAGVIVKKRTILLQVKSASNACNKLSWMPC